MGAKSSIFTIISIIFIKKNTKLLLQKKKKLPLTYKRGKKTLFSPPICIQMFDSYLYLLSIWIQILQLFLYKKKYKITFSKKTHYLT